MRILAFKLICFCSAVMLGQESYYNNEVKAIISLTQKDNLVTATATASNLSEIDQPIRYEFATIKKDSLNNSNKTSQSGRGTVQAGFRATLATTTINLNVPYQINLMLLIYNLENKLIGKEVKTIAANTLTLEKPKVDTADGVEIRGIVTEKTRTKPARDFYDLFYRLYNTYQINGKEIVTIKEQIGFGRSSRIEVLIGNSKIYEFVLNPQAKYLKEMANISVGQVNKYFNEKNNQVRQQ